MLLCGMHKQQRRQQIKQRQFKTIWVVVVCNSEHARANWDHHSSLPLLKMYIYKSIKLELGYDTFVQVVRAAVGPRSHSKTISLKKHH